MAIDTSTVWLVPLSDRASIAGSLGLAGASAYGAYRLLAPRQVLPSPEPVAPEEYFSPAEIRAAKRFGRPQTALGLGRTAIELAVVGRLVARMPRNPAAGVLRRRDRSTGRDALAAGGTAAALAVTTTALQLPLSVVSRKRSLDVGLATDSWSSWGSDLVKSTAIDAGLTGALLAGSSALASRTGERWWLYASGAIVGVSILAGVLAPVVMDPVFNHFEPLPDGGTRSDVLGLAKEAGVSVGEVFSVDASRRTTSVNAYVNGLGPTKRVVLFDNLISGYSRDEVRFVVAHELGHVAHRDVPRLMVFLALSAPGSMLAMQQLAGRWGGLTGAPAVPALSLATWAVGAPLVLSGAALSRAVERRTDHFGLGLSDAPEALISFFRRIAVQNRADVTPHRLTRGLLATHPPITERIGAALAYQRSTGRRTPADS